VLLSTYKARLSATEDASDWVGLSFDGIPSGNLRYETGQRRR